MTSNTARTVAIITLTSAVYAVFCACVVYMASYRTWPSPVDDARGVISQPIKHEKMVFYLRRDRDRDGGFVDGYDMLTPHEVRLIADFCNSYESGGCP